MSLGISVYATYDYQWAAYYLLPSRAWQMMAGAILAIAASSVVRFNADSRWLSALSLMAILFIFLPAIFYSKETRFLGFAALWPTLGAALIVFLGLIGCRGWIIRFLGAAPLRSVGLISCSLYLWHWPIFAFLRNYQADVRLSIGASILGIVASFILTV